LRDKPRAADKDNPSESKCKDKPTTKESLVHGEDSKQNAHSLL
jgi:hypothetical protein